MIVRQSSGDFSIPKGEIIVRHYRYFLTISQQNPGKRYFGKISFSVRHWREWSMREFRSQTDES
jgi:hypothetical protein